MNTFDVGQEIALVMNFTDEADAPVDPETITVTVERPDGTTITPSTTNPAPGEHRARVTLDQSGRWEWKAVTTGTVKTAGRRAFAVRKDTVG